MRSFTKLFRCRIGLRTRVRSVVEIQRAEEVCSDGRIESQMPPLNVKSPGLPE